MKKTPWLHVLPHHVGVYERKSVRDNVIFSFWNGRVWSPAGGTVDDAFKYKHLRSVFQSLPWRGLAQLPEDRRGLGPYVSRIANANPAWTHGRVLARAKAEITGARIDDQL